MNGDFVGEFFRFGGVFWGIASREIYRKNL